MFETKEEIQAAITKLMLATSVLRKGDTLSWEDIEKEIGVARYTASWCWIVRNFRRRIRDERAIVTRASQGLGIRFLTDKEAATDNWRDRRVSRQCTWGLKEKNTIDQSNLTLGERRLLAVQKDKMRIARRSARQNIRETKKVRQTEVNPIRKLAKA